MARNKFDIDEDLDSPFNIKHFKRLANYIKPYKNRVIVTAILMIVATISGLAAPYFMKVAIDSIIPDKDVKGLIILSILFLFTLVINTICLKFKIRNMNYVGQNIIYNIRADLFAKLQKLPFTYYDSRPHGKILIRVVNYVNSLSDLITNGIINLITDLFSLIFIIIFMFIINARLTLVCLAGLPFLVLASFILKKAQRKTSQASSAKLSNLNAYLHESICGMKVTQSFAREEENLRICRDLGFEYRKAWMKFVVAQFALWPIIETVSVIGVSMVYIFGIAWIGKGVTVGILVAFIGYIWRFWMPITNIGNFYNQIIVAMSYMERIFETIDENPIVDDLPGAYEMPAIKGNVEFENVSFSYDTNEIILHDVSLKVKTGDTIALVGPTGAGKTTIVNLISRFYDVDSGNVLIDDINVRAVTLHSLRKQMGIMLQDSFTFSGTIMDNIRYSKLDATDEEVIEASKAVKAHDFIIGLNDEYNTQVNERGSRLSSGQRQLISFARALLADPRILILDEATSSIDTKTELALQEGIQKLLAGRTSFIIAHRLSTIKNATRILYIDNGHIVEQGTHEELINAQGAYWKLYTAQFSFLEAI